MLTNGHPLLSADVVTREFLDEIECAETARRVIRLRDRWTQAPCPPDWGGFALGAASYINGADSQETYLAAAASTNLVLFEVFGDLYGALRDFLEYLLDEPVSYDERLALPGFHIFEFYGDKSANDRVAERAHFDMHFRHAVPGLKPDATLSFTLPLQQPCGGPGLVVWPFRSDEAVRRNLSGRDFAAQHRCGEVSYEVGRLILHDGLVLHAIGATGDPAPEGQRITLQGHGIRHKGRWTLYW
jgi:hypothetical protein